MILKHAKAKGGVPYYSHPTPTDQKLVHLVGPNRKYMDETLAEYRIIMHRRGAKDKESFMFLATPSKNQEGYKNNNIYGKRGYLKISGPNKVEKENIHTPGVPEVPQDIGRLVHNCYPRLVEVSVRCGKDQEKECMRKRLVPEYVCYDPEKEMTYTMTKRCERVFLRDRGRKLPITPDAVRCFEILVKEYRENAKQQETPEVFQTILPQNGRINSDDLLYFREENGKAAELIPVRISRKVDNRPIGKRLREDLRPCHGEWIEEDEELSKLDAYPAEKKLFTRHPKGLCPTCRLFGTGAYKGRVRFGFAFLNGEAKWLRPGENPPDRKLTLPLLERPRPTWAIRYNDKENDKVPGRKFYVHHNGWEGINKGRHPIINEPLDSENTFTFEIFFENLEPHELGLLLSSLRLEKGLAHKLGMAKFMGFGSIGIDVENVSLREKSGVWENKTGNDVDGWIREGKNKAAEWSGEEKGNKSDHTAALKRLLYFPKDQNPKVHYPPLKKEKEGRVPGYEELKQEFKEKGSDRKKGFTRKELLTMPWMPWHLAK